MNKNKMMEAIDYVYDKYVNRFRELEEILNKNGANKDDSGELGYFEGMTDDQIKNTYDDYRKFLIENLNKKVIVDDSYIVELFEIKYI